MPTSDATPADDHHPLAADLSTKATDSEPEPEPENDDEEEYEEIEEEVEVEEEVEEEVEVEEEDEEDEDEDGDEDEDEDEEEDGIGEDLSPIDEDHRNDISRLMESNGYEEQFRSGSNSEKPVANLPSETPAIEDGSGKSEISGPSETQEEVHVDSEVSKYRNIGKQPVDFEDYELREFAADSKDSAAFVGKRTPEDRSDAHHDSSPSPCDNGIMNTEDIKPFSFSGKEVIAVIPAKDGSGQDANGVSCSEEETKEMHMRSGEDINLMAPRLAIPQIRPRSLSPGDEFKDGNKRPAVKCEFFAKGWCIKGNSCRFLHIRNRADVSDQQPEGSVGAANKKIELHADEGLRDGCGRSALPVFPDAATSSVAYGTSFSAERIPPWEHGESPRWKSELPSYKENHRTTSIKDVGRESIRQNWHFDDHGNYASQIVGGSSPMDRRTYHGTFSSSYLMSLDTNQSTGVATYSTTSEEMASKRSQFLPTDHNLPALSRSLNSSSASLPTSGMLTSNNIPAWTRSSFSLSSSSWNAHPLGAQKLLDSDREYHASRSGSVQRSSSPFSGSESENQSRIIISGDPLRSTGYKMKISSDDWEPSIPFRSSFLMNQSLSSPGSQYDPIRDSIEQPVGFSKPSSSSKGTSIGTHFRINDDSILTGTMGPEYNSDKHHISGHHNFPGNVFDNGYGKDLFSTEKTKGTTGAERKNRNTFPEEELLSSPAYVREIMKANKISIEHSSGIQSDGPRQKTESKLDRARQNNDIDVLKTDGNEYKESKSVRHFRAALVDFVKELVKPTWREGYLSKDAHKKIVKTAVEKVLSTLQPHQIPSTAESIKLYFSSSQPKISKLVEGYVNKYGKS